MASNPDLSEAEGFPRLWAFRTKAKGDPGPSGQWITVSWGGGLLVTHCVNILTDLFHASPLPLLTQTVRFCFHFIEESSQGKRG